jgi:hypothetical protein
VDTVEDIQWGVEFTSGGMTDQWSGKDGRTSAFNFQLVTSPYANFPHPYSLTGFAAPGNDQTHR